MNKRVTKEIEDKLSEDLFNLLKNYREYDMQKIMHELISSTTYYSCCNAPNVSEAMRTILDAVKFGLEGFEHAEKKEKTNE